MKTKTTIFFLIFCSLFLVTCTNNKRSISNDVALRIKADSADLTALIRDAYRWQETSNFRPFNYDVMDTLLVGMDWEKNKKASDEIAKTNYFDKKFLDNLNEIAKQIDGYCKNSNSKYEANLIPPWDDDANDWCNCQMTPDNYWEKLTISDLKDYTDSADFNWTWGDKFYYAVKASKQKGKWRISYLQGFDKKNYTILSE